MKTAASSDFSSPINMMNIIFMAAASRMAGVRLEHDGRFVGPRVSKPGAVNRRPVLHREVMDCATRRLSPPFPFLIRQFR
jgi:hypothetical protein